MWPYVLRRTILRQKYRNSIQRKYWIFHGWCLQNGTLSIYVTERWDRTEACLKSLFECGYGSGVSVLWSETDFYHIWDQSQVTIVWNTKETGDIYWQNTLKSSVVLLLFEHICFPDNFTYKILKECNLVYCTWHNIV